MHRTKPSRARARILVPSALAAAILFTAAAPASALGDADRTAAPRVAAGPIDDLVNGILDAIKGLLPPGITLPDLNIPEIQLPEIQLPEIQLPQIPGVELPQIPGIELPALPPLNPPTLPDPAAPVELVPEIPDIPDIPDLPALPVGLGDLP